VLDVQIGFASTWGRWSERDAEGADPHLRTNSAVSEVEAEVLRVVAANPDRYAISPRRRVTVKPNDFPETGYGRLEFA
jgi:hypothetical protein